MDIGNDVTIIIPILNPTDRLAQVVDGLVGVGFRDFVIVNDGSDDEHSPQFDRLGERPECTVLSHAKNMGKGAALKTAFSFVQETRPEKKGVVTVDGDGQHLMEDVVSCAVALLKSDEGFVLGIRKFHGSDIPRRNSLGNRTSTFVLRVLFDVNLADTQTGLRAISARHIPLLLETEGSRFEYETNMLIEFRRHNISFEEVPITAVYEEGSNKRSHFRPFADTARIFLRILKYAMSGVLSFLLDIGIFWLALTLLGGHLGRWDIVVCTVIARAVSSFFNFNFNRAFVFKRKKAYGSQLLRYYTLAVSLMLLSAGALWLLAQLSGVAGTAGLVTLLKILVDAALFFGSYAISRNWVFER